jgi:kynurenine formamidase
MRHWRTDAYFDGHPYLTADAAAHLLAEAAVLVGIDSLNVDDIRDGERPAHSILLDAGIPICEHLTGLDRLPSSGFRFSAVPVKIRAMGRFPFARTRRWLDGALQSRSPRAVPWLVVWERSGTGGHVVCP